MKCYLSVSRWALSEESLFELQTLTISGHGQVRVGEAFRKPLRDWSRYDEWRRHRVTMSSKRRLQFGLRGMLVLTTLAAISFSVYRRYTAYLAIDAIQKKAVFVRPEPKATGWQRLYSNDVYRVHHLSFHSSFGVADEDVAAITRLPWIRRLSLHRTQVTDKAAAFVASLKQLEALSFEATGLTDDGMASLAELTELKELSLNNLRLTDKGLKHLKSMTEMEELLLNGTMPTTLEHFRDMTKLKRFELRTHGALIDPSSLSSFAGMTQLKKLAVPELSATRSDFDELRNLVSLEGLEIGSSQIAKLEAEVWQRYPNLKYISVGCTGDFAMEGHANIKGIVVTGQPRTVTLRGLPSLTRFASRSPTLDTELVIEDCPALWQLELHSIKSARALNLDHVARIHVWNVESLKLRGLPAVRHVRFLETRLTDSILEEVGSVGGVVGLQDMRWERVVVEDFAALEVLQRHQNLSKLEIYSQRRGLPPMKYLTDEEADLAVKFLQGFPKLTELVLPREWTRNPGMLKGLLEMRQLTKLGIHFDTDAGNDWEALLELPKLQQLYLDSYEHNGRVNRLYYSYTPEETDHPRYKSEVVNGRRFLVQW